VAFPTLQHPRGGSHVLKQLAAITPIIWRVQFAQRHFKEMGSVCVGFTGGGVDKSKFKGTGNECIGGTDL
jgi:hypothetical protein